MAKYIGEAINTFYCGYDDLDSLKTLGEKLIRVKFDILYRGRLMDINFVCTPAIYMNKSTGFAHKYDLSPLGHLISVKPIDDIAGITGQELIHFNHMICSTKHSQILTMGTQQMGIINHFCEEYYVVDSSDILCTQQRLLLHSDRRFPSSENCVFSMIQKILSDHPEVDSFWKPVKNIKATDIDNHSILIIGFINFNVDKIVGMTLREIMTEIDDELVDLFNVHSNEIFNSNINSMICYESTEECRVLLYQLPESKKVVENQDSVAPIKPTKKKFRLFGGDKK